MGNGTADVFSNGGKAFRFVFSAIAFGIFSMPAKIF
jgi:hypothetical protein